MNQTQIIDDGNHIRDSSSDDRFGSQGLPQVHLRIACTARKLREPRRDYRNSMRRSRPRAGKLFTPRTRVLSPRRCPQRVSEYFPFSSLLDRSCNTSVLHIASALRLRTQVQSATNNASSPIPRLLRSYRDYDVETCIPHSRTTMSRAILELFHRKS